MMKWILLLVVCLGLVGCKKKEGCTKDTECKGSRICEAGRCKEPLVRKRTKPKPLLKVIGKRTDELLKITVRKIEKRGDKQAPMFTLELSAPPWHRKVKIPVGGKVYVEGYLFGRHSKGGSRFVELARIYSDVVPHKEAKSLGLHFKTEAGGKKFSLVRLVQPAPGWEKLTSGLGFLTQAVLCKSGGAAGEDWEVRLRKHGGLECE